MIHKYAVQQPKHDWYMTDKYSLVSIKKIMKNLAVPRAYYCTVSCNHRLGYG